MCLLKVQFSLVSYDPCYSATFTGSGREEDIFLPKAVHHPCKDDALLDEDPWKTVCKNPHQCNNFSLLVLFSNFGLPGSTDSWGNARNFFLTLIHSSSDEPKSRKIFIEENKENRFLSTNMTGSDPRVKIFEPIPQLAHVLLFWVMEKKEEIGIK